MSELKDIPPTQHKDETQNGSKEEKKKARQRIADAIARSQANRTQANRTQASKSEEKEKKTSEESIDLRLLWRVLVARARPSIHNFLQESWRNLWKNLRYDIWRKIAALIMAIVIWLIIGNPASDIVEATFFVPIHATGLNDSSISRDFPEQVTIRVEGMLETIEMLDSTAFHAFVDLHNVTDAYLEPVHISTPTGVRLLQQDPQNIAGTVEILQYRSFPVHATVLQQEDGQYTRALATPSNITAFGAEKDIARVASVLLMVTGESEQIVPHALDSHGARVTDIRFNPNLVKVRLQREDTFMTKRIPVTLDFKHLSSQLEVEYQHLSSNELQLRARYETARANLHALEQLTIPIDVAGYGAGLYSLDVPLELPEGVSLIGNALTLDLELVPAHTVETIDVDTLLVPERRDITAPNTTTNRTTNSDASEVTNTTDTSEAVD